MAHNCRNTLCDTPHYQEAPDTGYDDSTIPIECGECNVQVEGVASMASHLIDFHPSYSLPEVTATARLWADYAYEKAEDDYINNQEAAREESLEDRDD